MTHSEALIKKGYHITPQAAEMLDRGFVGNGCGAGVFDRILIILILRWYKAKVDVACEIHDAAYSASRSVKSEANKILADAYFDLNIRNELRHKPSDAVDKIATRFHAAVTLKGKTAYWAK